MLCTYMRKLQKKAETEKVDINGESSNLDNTILTSLDADDLETVSGLVINLLRNPLLGIELLHRGVWVRPDAKVL